MKPRTLLVLLTLVVVLGAFIWFYERKLPSSDERAELGKKVVSVKKDDIQAVTLETGNGKVVLERTAAPSTAKDKKDKKDQKDKEKKAGEGEEEAQGQPASEWRLVQPMAARADAFAVDGLLDALTGMQKSRTLEKVDRAAVGLDKPRATVRLKTAEGETELRLGTEVPTGGELIAGVKDKAGDATYVVADSILTQVDREPGSWRDRQLFRASRDAISRITITTSSPGGPIILAQKDGLFHLERPTVDRADRERSDDLYADLSGLTAEKFIDDKARPLAELGLQPPRAVVDVAFEKGEPLRIEIGGPVGPAEAAPAPPAPGQPPGQPPAAQGMVYARIGSQIFETRTRLADTALHPAADWRARGLSAFEVYQIEGATVHQDKSDLRLTRAGTDWKRGDQLISYVPVSDFFFALTGAKADRLLTAAEAAALGSSPGGGLAKPALTVDLETKEAGKETLTLYPAVAAGTPARVGGRDVLLLLPADKLAEILGKLAEVRNAKPLK
jgi:hypothetical protein